MAKEEEDKLEEIEVSEAGASPPFGVESTPVKIEGRTRRGKSVATLEVGEGPFAELSVDTFAVPSEQPLERNEDPDRRMSGPEPTVFGGANPETPSVAVDDPNAVPAERTDAERIGGALDEVVQKGNLLSDVPRIDYVRLVRSTPFLLCAMLVTLITATVIIRLGVATETYVRTSVFFNNYTGLNEDEQAGLQVQINEIMRNLPLRRGAIDKLKEKAPDLKPGFLDNSLIFHRLDSITWLPEGRVQLRVDSDDPASDLIRLQAVSDSFYDQMKEYMLKLDTLRGQKQDLERQHLLLVQQDRTLKKDIDDLSLKAEPYAEMKQSRDAMERYLEMADDSNPLRLVARQNLTRLTAVADQARDASLRRDALTDERVKTQKSMDATVVEISKVQRQIELFPWPDPPDAKTLFVKDTRSFQTIVLRIAWVVIVAVFGGAILLIHLQDQRRAEAARRERRGKLKAQLSMEPDQP